jgi:hypothetical protein
MTDIERMAREAGYSVSKQGICFQQHGAEDESELLTRFAALVRAQERERIARHFDARNTGKDGKPLGLGWYEPHEPAEIIRGELDAPDHAAIRST